MKIFSGFIYGFELKDPFVLICEGLIATFPNFKYKFFRKITVRCLEISINTSVCKNDNIFLLNWESVTRINTTE